MKQEKKCIETTVKQPNGDHFLINPLHQYVLGLPEKKQTMMTVKIPGKKIKKKTCEMEK